MKWVSILLLLCGLMAAPGRVTVAVESGAGERYVVAWSFELGSQERSAVWDYVGVAGVPGDEHVVAVEKSMEPGSRQDVRFRVWEIAKDGKVIKQTDLKSRRSREMGEVAWPGTVAVVFASDDQSLRIVGMIDSTHEWSLIKLDAGRQQSWSRPLPAAIAGYRFRRGVPIPGRNESILVGRSDDKAIATTLNGNGDIGWSRTYQHGGTPSQFTDVVALDDGTFLFAGSTGGRNKSGNDELKVWLVHCDRDGRTLHDRSFPGRSARIAGPLADGRVAVAYDASLGFGTRSKVMVLKPDLCAEEDASADMPAMGLSFFGGMARTSATRFFVAVGARDQVPLRCFDQRANVVTSIDLPVGKCSGTIEVVAAGEMVAVAVPTSFAGPGNCSIDGGVLFGVAPIGR